MNNTRMFSKINIIPSLFLTHCFIWRHPTCHGKFCSQSHSIIRYKAKEWKIDPDRILLTGGSAGAASSMWLATHDDMADPNSDDPVARQSTRVAGAIGEAAKQLGPLLIEKRIGPETLKHGMLFKPFGVDNIEELKKNWDSKYKALSNEYTA